MNFVKADDELWRLIAEGDEKAFSFVYDKYAKELYKYGRRFTGDTDLISDVLQDIFVHIWEAREKLSIQKSIKFYLFSSLRREIIKRINRSYSGESFDEFQHKMSWNESFEQVLLQNQIIFERNHKITEALESLPSRQKEAIHLRYLEEMDYEDISELMGVKITTLYNLIFTGLKTLKEKLPNRKMLIFLLLLLLGNV
ncbi:RNA polymerase sigma factor [Echinicola shivajiensis]|uniref:RNA polymerase sigma factor n=1 Tax=Echinicola shivajiensis TaxID=1035916 RepID=UPI001BFC19DE|nr:RNA polymerase sigma factor [Echinicola shivajiensis]